MVSLLPFIALVMHSGIAVVQPTNAGIGYKIYRIGGFIDDFGIGEVY
jgi:hypothetical protein